MSTAGDYGLKGALCTAGGGAGRGVGGAEPIHDCCWPPTDQKQKTFKLNKRNKPKQRWT